MKYFVGYLASGEIVDYYRSITSELASRFGIIDNSKRVPPHLTLLYPQELEDIIEYEAKIENYIVDKKPIIFKIKGFGEFNGPDGTIFLTPESNPTLQSFVREFIVNFVGINEYKKFGDDFHLHMSIARHLDDNKLILIREYLQTFNTPEFELLFDNISIFQFDSGVWNVRKSFVMR